MFCQYLCGLIKLFCPQTFLIIPIQKAYNGEKLTSIDLGSNVEASPAIFGDMMVVGTRNGRIHGITIK